MKVLKIISGGQTGVDRAALDVALELGINCGGWCPQGRRAEDGRIPEHYPVEETPWSAGHITSPSNPRQAVLIRNVPFWATRCRPTRLNSTSQRTTAS